MRQVKNNKGFTLVELIVVITILAILGTIAFISLQGYSSDARNSKRQSDLSSLSSKMNILATNGTNVTDMITGNDAQTLTFTGNAGLGGNGAATSTGKYKAGNVNYTVLGVKSEDYQDPSKTVDYKAGSTSYVGGAFELAATLESEGATDGVAYLLGNYNARTSANASATGSIDAANTDTITLSDGIGIFKKSDLIKDSAGTTGAVLSVSSDLSVIKVDATLSGTTFSLAEDDVSSLIKDASGNGTPVQNNSETNVPYKL